MAKVNGCPLGTHFVRTHNRRTQSGFTVVHEHCRKNPKSKAHFFYKSNLDYIFEKNHGKYKYKKLNRVRGFSQDKGQYDEYIQFWLCYWKEFGLIKDDIDPLLIKALIAVESSFREKVVTKMPGSSATGLMQIVKRTMAILAGKIGKEIRKANIDITQEEAKEANANIAAGIRWVIYKVTTSPWRRKKSKQDRVFGGLKYYHSWDEEGEIYAHKVLELYNASK